LKRFIWCDKLVKIKEKIRFDTVITIKPQWLASNMDIQLNRQYRLFSVVEHVGEFAHRGHYVSYTLDSNDDWQKFDDQKVGERDVSEVLDSSQAYLMFYELIY
jgi:ubiquitin C-terminal hydrolase